MGTKRRKVLPQRAGISAAAIEAWQTGDFHALNRELGVAPCHASPLTTYSARPPAWALARPAAHPFLLESWPKAWALRVALIAAAGEPGRFDRHGNPLGQ